ncbi:PH domain-containing protein [Streptomyces himalayensis]|uniref:PH domain-containing protein n=1 Tax=Streptomyces himalayensis TaxID=2820085 RepID=UPI001FEAFFC0|nr:PH domain-containing protein [Streptomyces himalayensis]
METGTGAEDGTGAGAGDGTGAGAGNGAEARAGVGAGVGGSVQAAGTGNAETEPEWTGLPPGLLRMRRLLLVVWLVPLTVAAGLLPGLLAGPGWAAFALLPLALLLWGWSMLGRNWRSWRYAERADDLLISRGVLWREETIVPYGRMQLVEVTSGPVERHFGLASVQLHTAAAASDARIPGLLPTEAERLRDRLTELGEARSAGL